MKDTKKKKKTTGSRKIKESKTSPQPAPEIARQQEGKTINVSELPESCKWKTIFTQLVQNASHSKVCVVAYLEPLGSPIEKKRWTAWIGYPDVRDLKPIIKDVDQPFIPQLDIIWRCENIHDAESVLMMGERLDRETALKLFPDWNVISYFE